MPDISLIKVEVAGDIRLVNAADCAEDFDISGTEQIEPGTVMVLNGDGGLERSRQAYDRTVAGVISGAGDYKPGITLDKRHSEAIRLPLALLGKVSCSGSFSATTMTKHREKQ